MAYMKDTAGVRLDTLAVGDVVNKVKRTKTALFSFGGTRTTGTTDSDANVRLPFTLPVRTKRWRAHFVNKDLRVNTNYGTVALTGGWVGKHAVATTALTGGRLPTYKFTPGSAAQDIASASLTGGNEYVSAWVTDPARQIQPFTEYLLSYGMTCTAAQTNVYQNSRGAIVSGASHANEDAPTTIPAATSNTPLGVWIEYDFDGSEQVGLYIGDSIADGYTAANGYLGQWPHLAAHRLGGVCVNSSFAGGQAAHWATPSDLKHTRLTSLDIDYAVIALGTNDIAISHVYQLLRDDWLTISDWLRGTLGVTRIFGVTVLPSPGTHDATMVPNRTSFNSWLLNNNAGLSGVIDAADFFKSPSNGNKLDARYDNDRTHLDQRGYQRFAALAASTIAPVGAEGRST